MGHPQAPTVSLETASAQESAAPASPFARTLSHLRSRYQYWRPEPLPVGAYIVDDELYVAQMRRADTSGLIVGASYHTQIPAGLIARDDHVELRRVLKAAFAKANVRGGAVTTVLPDEKVRVFTVSYHVEPRQSEDDALVRTLTDRIEGLADHVIDWIPVRLAPEGRRRLAIVVSAASGDVVRHAELWRRAGFPPASMEVVPTATRRLMGQFGKKQDHNVLIINTRQSASEMTLYSGRRLQFHQNLDFSPSALTQQVATSLSMTPVQAQRMIQRFGTGGIEQEFHSTAPDELALLPVRQTLREIIYPQLVELVEQVNRALLFAASENRGQAVEEIRLLGQISGWPGIHDTLSDLLHVNVSDFRSTLQHFGAGNLDLSGTTAGHSIAIGLSLRGLNLAANREPHATESPEPAVDELTDVGVAAHAQVTTGRIEPGHPLGAAR